MAIPIRCQANVYEDGFETIVLLKEGSLYGIDGGYELHEISRSYAGGVIRNRMKHILTMYHEHMRQANLYKRSKNFAEMDRYRNYANVSKKEYDAVEKLFIAFKSFKSTRVRKPDTRPAVNVECKFCRPGMPTKIGPQPFRKEMKVN